MIKLYPFACIKDRYYIIHNNVTKGIIDYVIDENDEVFIQMIKVYEEHRREGVGRQTMEYMKQFV